MMKAVRVQYTVRPEYVAQNKSNIEAVMRAIKANPIEGMMYSSYNVHGDATTFVHINIAKDSETMAKLNDVEEFKTFRMELKASQPVSPPARTDMDLVAAGFDL